MDDFVELRIPRDIADALAEWTECEAIRLHREDDGSVTLQVTDDLDALTAPEETAA